MSAKKPWVRSRNQRIVAGVCGGVAERFGWRVTIVRLVWVVGTVLPILPGLPLYVALWFFLPYDDDSR